MYRRYYLYIKFDVEVVPSIQYLPSEENNGPSDEIFRLSTHVIYKSLPEQERWWDWNQNARTESDIEARDAFVAEYDKNNEVTARRYLCILSN